MTIEELEKEIKDLEDVAQQNVLNHHVLLGRIAQSKDLLKKMQEKAKEVVEVVGEIV